MSGRLREMAREWLRGPRSGGVPDAYTVDDLAALLARVQAEERRSSFQLFNDAMNEFVENMRVDPENARKTMKRRMLSALSPDPEVKL